MLSLHSGPRRWSRHRTERSDKGAVGRPHSALVYPKSEAVAVNAAVTPRIVNGRAGSSQTSTRISSTGWGASAPIEQITKRALLCLVSLSSPVTHGPRIERDRRPRKSVTVSLSACS